MNLRAKFLLLYTGIFLFLIGFFLFFYFNLETKNFKNIEYKYIYSTFEHVDTDLNKQVKILKNLTKNEAYWDDIYLFVQGKNKNFVQSNFDPKNTTLKDYGINIYAVLNLKKKTVLNRCYPKSLNCDELLNNLIKSITFNYEKTGFIWIDKHPWIVSVQYILPTSGKGKKAGFLIFGKMVKTPELSLDYIKFANYPIQIPFPDKKIRLTNGELYLKENENNYIFSLMEEDINKKLLPIYSGSIKPVIMQQAYTFMIIAGSIFVSMFLVTFVALYFLFRNFFRQPLANIIEKLRNVAEKGDFNRRLPENYNSKEFKTLAKEINLLLSAAENYLKQAKEKSHMFEVLAENAPVGVYLFREKIEYMNPFIENILGYTPAEVIGRPFTDFLTEVDPELREKIIKNVQRRLKGEKFRNEFQIKIRAKDGTLKDILIISNTVFINGKPYGMGIAIDITQIKELEKKLKEMIEKDSLTELLSRRGFYNKLDYFINLYRKNRNKFFLLFIDLNHFKNINDNYGHSMGDKVLKVIADRLKTALWKEDIVGRLGGDEFGVIIPNFAKFEDIVIILEKIIREIEKPVEVNGLKFTITASIGITVFPEDGTTAEQLIKRADIAMYKAKEKSRKTNQSSFVFFSPEFEKHIKEKFEIEKELKRAVQESSEEFFVLYQPIFDLQANRPVKVEALVRWNSAKFGLMQPSVFIPVAEETGIISSITKIVIEKVTEQLKKWQEKGIELRASINISPIDFKNKDVLEFLINKVIENNLQGKICIEITENILLENIDHNKRILDKLTLNGIEVMLDDFGTGYSSLTYLKKFPISVLKIDREFIKDMTHDEYDRGIVFTVIKLTQILSMDSLAEGIETEEHLNILKEFGCTYGQGYYFSKPVTPQEIENKYFSTISI
ncbi:EAL domain-containing protein [Persephonella sp.]|uniref:EAL domain-containing protein n=1 Tax=Persephonella sp. TaxID=2060922 RepID=UPI00260776B9|nr:EAL domain-containing protein [Persephonella sp.]